MKKFFYGLVAAVGTFPVFSTAHAATITISTSVPGMAANSASTPGTFVAGFYQFALMIAGILAFGIIVYGGVKYMASAGNPSGQGDAKEWIEAALLGLLLLVGAYFILNVVNPQLTTLSLPSLTAVNIQAPTTATPTSSNLNNIINPPTNCNPACVPPKTCKMYQIDGGSGMYSSGPTATYDCE
jgi:hypothetical protein